MNIEIKKVALSELSETKNNPRQITKDEFETLKRSLTDFPKMQEIREIVVDENYTILGGHQRVKAMKANGQTEATVKVVTGLTDEEKREFVVKDNINNGEWDMDILANAWDDEPLDDWGLETPAKATGEGLVDELKDSKYVEKENYFIKKPFIVVFYDENSKKKLEDKLGIELDNDTYDARDL